MPYIDSLVDSYIFDYCQSFNVMFKLFFRVVKYITSESTLKDDADPTVTPEKALMDKEKELLEKLKVFYFSGEF